MLEKFLERAGQWIIGRRLWVAVIAVWVLLAVGMALFAPSLTEVGVMNEALFLPQNSNYLRAKEILKEKFPSQVAEGQGLLVFYNPNGLSEEDLAYARDLAQWLRSAEAPEQVQRVVTVFEKPELKDVFLSKDNQAMLVPVDFSTADYDPKTNEAVAAVREHVQATAPRDLAVYLTGPAAMGKDMFDTVLESTDRTTIVTILLVIFVLLLVYRSPVAALVPLVSIAAAFLVARGMLGLAAQSGVELTSMLDALLVVLIFGVGTDYALFLISRFREEVGKGNGRSEAMVRSVSKIGPVITASAATVIIGLLGMMVADFGMTRTNGPAMSLGILIALLAALSLTPSLLQLFGERLFWPFHRSLATQRIGEGLINWRKIGQFVTDHPVLVTVVVLVVLLLPYPVWAQMNSTFNILSEIPGDMDSARGFQIIQDHFSAGEFAPVTVILTSPQGDPLAPDALRDVARVTDALAAVDGVEKVRSIVRPTGDPASSDMLRVDGQLQMLADQVRRMTAALDNPAQLGQMTQGQESPQQAFDTLRAYLEELGTAFPEVKNDPAYTDAVTALDTLAARMDEMLSQARVDTQLQAMADRVEGMAAQVANPQALAQSGAQGQETASGFDMLRDYLGELASTYPEVKDAPEYQDALTTLDELQQRMATMQAQMQVTSQLQGMAKQVQGMQQALANPQTLSAGQAGENPTQGLTMLAEYLQGLAQAYPDVGQEAAYRDALSRLQRVQQAVQAMQAQASVANQLAMLTQQLQGMQKLLANPQALAQAGQQGQNPAQGLELIAAYLQELGDAYPQVKQMPQYGDALQRVDNLATAFAQMQQAPIASAGAPPAQMQAAMQAMQQDVAALQQDLGVLQQSFAQHPEAVLFPKSLPTPPEAAAAMKQVQDDVAALGDDLQALAQTFAEKHPQATYVPQGMFDRPEVQQALQQTQERLKTFAQDLRDLSKRFAGRDLYFFPRSIASQGEAATVLEETRSEVAHFVDTLDMLAKRFAGQDAYFIPQTFLDQMPELKQLLDVFLSQDHTTVQFTVLLSGDPYSLKTADVIDHLKTTLDDTVAQVSQDSGRQYTGYLGGVPVMSHDLKRTVDRDFNKVRAVVIAGVFLVFVVLLQSLIAPIYLVLSVLLSYGTTMGLVTLLFQKVLGYEGVNYIIPIIIFVLLIALGADYNIFLMSRVKEETERTGNAREGIRLATMYTGGIITSCGIILAGTFGALITSPLRMLLQIGVAVAIGVLVDTFVVRTLLVPGIATVLDKWNWWPMKKL